MMRRRLLSLAAAVAGVLVIGHATDAATIGVQTGFADWGSSLLTPTQSAGLTGYESQNWNTPSATHGIGVDPAWWTIGTLPTDAALVQDDGGVSSVTSATFTASAAAVVLTNANITTANDNLYKWGWGTTIGGAAATYTVTGLTASGYGTYDVIAYLSSHIFDGAAVQTTTLTINGSVIPVQINSFSDGTLVFQDATVIGNTGGHANYVRLTGLTSDTLSLSLASTAGSALGINGFQIISVPEPATLSLVGLGAISLLSKRRRQA